MIPILHPTMQSDKLKKLLKNQLAIEPKDASSPTFKAPIINIFRATLTPSTMEFVTNVLKRYVNLNYSSYEVKNRSDKDMDDQVSEEKEENNENVIREQKFAPAHYNLMLLSEPTPAKAQKGDSILQVLDPLYSSVIAHTPTNTCYVSASDKYGDAIVRLRSLLDEPDDAVKDTMADLIDEKMKLEQELNRLKLEVNQLQQERASLELELHQKDEVILKTQGEAQKKANQYKQDVKQLQEQLDTINGHNNNDEIKALRDEINAKKEKEAQMAEERNRQSEKLASYKDIMSGYESLLAKVVPEYEKLQEEHDTTKQHLATLEMAFSDVHTKYERCKTVIFGYKNNEETLSESLEKSNLVAKKYEERYETLKAHAKAQLEKANKELASAKEKQQTEVTKLTAFIRKLEIKNASLQQALDQKTKECADLAALCDEMAGPAP